VSVCLSFSEVGKAVSSGRQGVQRGVYNGVYTTARCTTMEKSSSPTAVSCVRVRTGCTHARRSVLRNEIVGQLKAPHCQPRISFLS